MPQDTDQTFITNRDGISLLDRFNHLIKGARNFDVLTGYFYTSGFKALHESLKNTDQDFDGDWHRSRDLQPN